MIPAGQALNCLALITDIKSVKELLPIEVEHKQCYRVYFAEFRRKSRLSMGVLPMEKLLGSDVHEIAFARLIEALD